MIVQAKDRTTGNAALDSKCAVTFKGIEQVGFAAVNTMP